ncbi:Deoxyribodipyrimidine photolyase family [Alloalcanivorax dieselolei B5]|uniref:Deoxyribodipyrimidine photo-lyase n=1 Tax=Alcanivorax dieselolei (strain DSM 16502 / CGMCC 1.3690 / MCCC 1A00001 / B-5) TaxID=930169 RepID=K0C4V9_ALCDB|nr:deoxyribodipyrimidine photo-lyase [Alloalcanivorax dieselolei]AFT68394.1 Deoxyribodipyrimidine photolyase family [Alloalcanivorax dieselolei B5]GGJ80861.1 deoxyribodipyrimidine photo-lyase [Alloalcanivorax dieselolei]
MAMRLVWFRNDLRCHGHTPLRQALAGAGPVLALYVLCPGQWDAHDVAPLRRWYVLESLRELGEELAARGVDLHVIDGGDFAGAVEVVQRFVADRGVTEVFCNREYPVNELNRDRAVARSLENTGVRIRGFDDGVLVPPRALNTGKGTPYTVFTAYKRRWDAWMEEKGPPLPETPRWPGGQGDFVGRATVRKALAELSVSPRLTELWQPGEAAAARQLERFVARDLAHYKNRRDIPCEAGTSGLSAALSAGTLAPAQAWWVARLAMRDAGVREGAACWIGELAWRDFYRQILHRFPMLAKGAPFRPETRLLQWNDNETLFNAWCQGRTGYPLVDAAMRQLLSTGWMHNRLRMLTAMFLTKHLFIDWRKGERFFMQHLIDGDVAANNGGWQWSASTGTDAAPYFRVFSPVRQSRRFDPQGHFIARYVPELAELDNDSVHEPWKQPLLSGDYPPPVVAHEGVKQRVEAAFRAARDTWRRQGEGAGSSGA